MHAFLGIITLLCALTFLSGCHSGTTRGMGSDISKIGSNMQK